MKQLSSMNKSTPFTLALLPLMITASLTANATDQQETIVVTASKHQQSLSSFDSSVQIKTGEELDKAGITQVMELEKVFPGLLIRTRGSRIYAGTTVRGISSPDFYSPTVSIYLDGVLQDSAFLSQELVNIDTVELLRGPQGTLYGGNAQGGVINITTQKATAMPTARTRLKLADKEQGIDLSAATSISENFYGDLSFRAYKEDGRITHVPTNTNDADETETLTGQVRLHYMPQGSPLSVTLSAAHDKMDSHEEWYLTEKEYQQKKTSQPLPDLARKVSSYSLTADYELGENKLTSITAYQDRDVDREFVGGKWQEDQDTFSEELRLATRYANNASSLVGIYYNHTQFDHVNSGYPGFYSEFNNRITKQTYALFGELFYPLTQTWDATVGLRISQEKADIDYSGRTGMAAIGAFANSYDDTLYSPKIALGWQVADNARVFVSATRGYRPGGFTYSPQTANDQQGFDPETSDNVELGWRSSWLDGILDFTGALYWIELRDLQLYTGNPGIQTLSNQGDATSKGIELDFALYPTDNLSLTLGGSFGDSTFSGNNSDPVTGNNLEGNSLPYAPKTTLVAGAEYIVPQTLLDGELTLLASANYNAKTYFNETNSLSQDGYTLVDLAAQYAFNEQITMKLYGTNITDETYVTYQFQSPMGTLSNYGKERIIGLDLSMEI